MKDFGGGGTEGEAQLEGSSSNSGMSGNSVNVIKLNLPNQNHKESLTFADTFFLSHK